VVTRDRLRRGSRGGTPLGERRGSRDRSNRSGTKRTCNATNRETGETDRTSERRSPRHRRATAAHHRSELFRVGHAGTARPSSSSSARRIALHPLLVPHRGWGLTTVRTACKLRSDFFERANPTFMCLDLDFASFRYSLACVSFDSCLILAEPDTLTKTLSTSARTPLVPLCRLPARPRRRSTLPSRAVLGGPLLTDQSHGSVRLV
jgi:hypothetical protein